MSNIKNEFFECVMSERSEEQNTAFIEMCKDLHTIRVIFGGRTGAQMRGHLAQKCIIPFFNNFILNDQDLKVIDISNLVENHGYSDDITVVRKNTQVQQLTDYIALRTNNLCVGINFKTGTSSFQVTTNALLRQYIDETFTLQNGSMIEGDILENLKQHKYINKLSDNITMCLLFDDRRGFQELNKAKCTLFTFDTLKAFNKTDKICVEYGSKLINYFCYYGKKKIMKMAYGAKQANALQRGISASFSNTWCSELFCNNIAGPHSVMAKKNLNNIITIGNLWL